MIIRTLAGSSTITFDRGRAQDTMRKIAVTLINLTITVIIGIKIISWRFPTSAHILSNARDFFCYFYNKAQLTLTVSRIAVLYSVIILLLL